MVLLLVVHRQQKFLRTNRRRDAHERRDERSSIRKQSPSNTHCPPPGTSPRATSSSRLASATSALDGNVRIMCSYRAAAPVLSPARARARAHSTSAIGASAVDG